MSTFIINMNDTIILNDTIVMKFTEVADKHLQIINESGTNSDDVKIVSVICGTIILLAIITAIVLILWHYKNVNTRMAIEAKKVDKEIKSKQDEVSRIEAEEKNRLARYFQKTIFDKIIVKKLEDVDSMQEEDMKNFCKNINDVVNSFFANIKV